MIEEFLGGFLFHPAALDYTDSTCSHGCSYCFASINKETRGGSIKAAINTLYSDKDNLKGRFLRDGYPICVSNRTDIFAKVNVNNAKALFTHLVEKENGIFIQTKGGDLFEDTFRLLDGKKNIVVYISITSLNEDVAAKQEPKAPTIKRRFEIAKWLSERGIMVVAAINPLSSAWITRKDFAEYANRCKSAGIQNIVIEVMDMSKDRERRINIARAEKLKEAIVQVRTGEDYPLMRDAVDYFIGNGFHVGKSGMPYKTEIYNNYKKALGKVMPNNQEFINLAIDENKKELYYSDYEKIIGKYLDLDRKYNSETLRRYLLRQNTRIWAKHRETDFSTFRNLIRVIWNEKKIPLSMQNHYFCIDTGKVDNDGNVIIGFDCSKKLRKE